MAQDENIPHPEDTGARILSGFNGSGVASPEDLRQRARELAIIDGVSPGEDEDPRYLAQAHRELQGESLDPADEMEDAARTAEPGELPDASGHRVPNLSQTDEASVGERLVAEGMDEAVHDQMLSASESLDHQERGLGKDDADEID